MPKLISGRSSSPGSANRKSSPPPAVSSARIRHDATLVDDIAAEAGIAKEVPSPLLQIQNRHLHRCLPRRPRRPRPDQAERMASGKGLREKYRPHYRHPRILRPAARQPPSVCSESKANPRLRPSHAKESTAPTKTASSAPSSLSSPTKPRAAAITTSPNAPPSSATPSAAPSSAPPLDAAIPAAGARTLVDLLWCGFRPTTNPGWKAGAPAAAVGPPVVSVTSPPTTRTPRSHHLRHRPRHIPTLRSTPGTPRSSAHIPRPHTHQQPVNFTQ